MLEKWYSKKGLEGGLVQKTEPWFQILNQTLPTQKRAWIMPHDSVFLKSRKRKLFLCSYSVLQMKTAAGYDRSVDQNVAGLFTVVHLGFSASMLSFLRRKVLLFYLLKFMWGWEIWKFEPEVHERSCESPFLAALVGFQTCWAHLRAALIII